jgi:PKD repeat protein
VDRQTLVSIQATPSSTDARATLPRSVDIRLVPSGVITPPGPPVPDFAFEPSAPTVAQTVVFDASDPSLDDRLTAYSWSFGDGGSASGRSAQYQFRQAGTFMVTLTVTDNAGARGSRSKAISVGEGSRPTASFVFSPALPGIGTEIFFNASESTTAPGRRIVSYNWEFGTGRTGSGVVVSKRYDTPGTYNVTLTVTDDAGLQGTTAKPVIVTTTGSGGLVAHFVFSPTAPTPGQVVNFNAAQSTSSDDAIIDYSWDFGDGSRQNGANPLVSHKFATAGDYVAILTVKDSRGRTSTTQQTVTVGEPTATPTP